MHKSTIFFALTTIAFAGTTAAIGWQLWNERHPSPQPAVSGAVSAHVPISIPRSEQSNPRFTAHSALLYDTKQGKVIYEQNGFEKLPIASITKLMTAMVALDHGIPWDQEAGILPDEYVQGGKLMLFQGETVTMRDLFNVSLLGSANNATLAYVRGLNIDEQEFIQAMNRKAVEIGLEQTNFVEVTGLNPKNTSTAYDVARLASHAFSHYPEIAKATSQPEYVFAAKGSGREHAVKNTNKLISGGNQQASGSKTGYLYEAGYCLDVQGTGETAGLLAVVLNSPSEPEHFADITRLLRLPANF